MMNEKYVQIALMDEGDVGPAVSLIAEAMNADEAAWAEKTMDAHFRAKACGVDDGRTYYVWKDGSEVLGMTGLHHYGWGPAENVWLGWFAVRPGLQGKGYGSRLFDATIEMARQSGYRKLFVETYQSETFEKARAFYTNKGFLQAGEIADYLPAGHAMVVFYKKISEDSFKL